MKKLKISGKVIYQNLGTGFWGIEGSDGQNWLPINMPEQLKIPNAKVTVSAKKIEGGVSMAMWGTPVKITSFSTVAP